MSHMEIIPTTATQILSPQTSGFLTASSSSGSTPFTHSLTPYTGCTFGSTSCGLFCYVPRSSVWIIRHKGEQWGAVVYVKENAPKLLEQELAHMGLDKRRKLRIFFSPNTDIYQPVVEPRYQLTRKCLEVFSGYDELDLVLLQTRSPLARRDFDLVKNLPFAWLSVTIESDLEELLNDMKGGPSFAARFKLIEDAAKMGVKTQIVVSPCLPFSQDFAAKLANSGAKRIVVDTFIDGDGTRGRRTAGSQLPAYFPNWKDCTKPQNLYQQLLEMGVDTGWSASGFCGIPSRQI
jgi:DNA repair photolyase